ANHFGLISIGEGQHESVFIISGQALFPVIIAGFMLAAILAAIMSTISSQLLVTSSAVVEDIVNINGNLKRDSIASITYGRLAVLAVAVLAGIFAWFRTDSILQLVAFAWAGFGAAFGPIVILALYWRKLTWQGALSGMIVGAATVGIWRQALGQPFGLYEIIPGFLFALIVAVLVSLATYKYNAEIEEEFNAAVRLATADANTIDAEFSGAHELHEPVIGFDGKPQLTS
ncbi:MAG: sodium:proline symporter, partial [Arcanobacterium sp.]|nr:sodium:proline symporter [Arcanobacterium sp.]